VVKNKSQKFTPHKGVNCLCLFDHNGFAEPLTANKQSTNSFTLFYLLMILRVPLATLKNMAGNENLRAANKAKKDEFYTQLVDIEKELKHYKEHFADKIVYCNCDDPEESNFFRYFALNFEHLKLKKLISTHFVYSDMFTPGETYKLEITKGLDVNADGRIDFSDAVKTTLMENGDFRSAECIELLKEADIVVTNPPFSLFREYVAQLVEYDKIFLIIGNVNAITYKEIFKLIKENKLWIGFSIRSGDREFGVPDDYPLNAAGQRIDEKGKKFIRIKGVRWFTNLDYEERHDDIILYKNYTPEEYPKYDNYDAINVDVTKEIPMDYAGAMGVPITFLDKYNPEQFEIVALGIVGSIDFTSNRKMEILDKNGKTTGKFTFNAKGTVYRLFDVKKDKTPAFKDVETGHLYSSIYARIIIKKTKKTA
jgi:hypothetical protein